MSKKCCESGGKKAEGGKSAANEPRIKVQDADGGDSDEENDVLFKVLLIGEAGVGKSCTLVRFTEDRFIEEAVLTLGVDYKIKQLDVDGEPFRMQIWDTAGQERFRTITSSYYRGSHGVIFMFDVSDKKSFDAIPKWIKEVDLYAGKGVSKLLCGNKADKAEREVTAKQAQELAGQYKMQYVESSAKDNTGIDKAFLSLAELVKAAAGKS